MAHYEELLANIGNTPLIKLRRASEETGCTILGKAEFLNPGQSVKDRAALSIVQSAMKSGKLGPGGTIVEGTAGNTGIGLAMIAGALGMKTVIVIPETQTEEKKQALRIYGAELIEVPAKPYRDPNNYIRISGRIAESLAAKEAGGAVWANQFDNEANREAHLQTTAPEIWQQTGGKIDGFCCAVGSGGTLGGVSLWMKDKNPGVQIGLADPHGAALYSYYTSGELSAEGSSITEGIGQGRITANLEGIAVDHAYRIDDGEALTWLYHLLEEEGMALGPSTGTNIAGAVRLAKTLGPGHTIVTILCDYGNRYQSKIYNAEFLRSKDLPVPAFLTREPRKSLYTEVLQS